MDAEKFKITPQDMEGKGVSAQSNPMELPEAQAKAVFDQLMKEVMVPRFNVLLEALKPIDLTPDLEKPVSTAVQAALDLKVDKERKTGSETEYKVLSDNNYSDQEAIKVSSAERDRHTHENKKVLDGITSQDVLDWRGGNVLTKDNEAPYEPAGQYNPATVKYVDEKVVKIGAADMTKAVYDPNGKSQDIFAYADAVALDAKVMTDDVTGDGYVMGMNNGALYCTGVAEGSGQVNVARQDTLQIVDDKVDTVKVSVDGIAKKPSGGQIVFPSQYFHFSPSVGNTPISVLGANHFSVVCISVDAEYTQSGHFEVHIFKNSNTTEHYIWDAVTCTSTKEPPTPYLMLNSVIAISGLNSTSADAYKRIHLLSSSVYADSKKHYYYNTKTRTWIELNPLPSSFAYGCACGEAYNVSTSNSKYNTGYDDLYIYPGGGNFVYVWSPNNDSVKILSGSNVTQTLFGALMLRFNKDIAIVGGSTTLELIDTPDYSECVILQYSTSTTFTITKIANPVYSSTVKKTASSFGCIFGYNAKTDFYRWSGGTSFSSCSLGTVKALINSIHHFYIYNGTTYILYSANVFIPQYTYRVYLPRGTKIYMLPLIKSAYMLSNYVGATPYFPFLRIDGDAFVVEENSIVTYTSSLPNLNLNIGSTKEGNGFDVGFYFEIGSGE